MRAKKEGRCTAHGKRLARIRALREEKKLLDWQAESVRVNKILALGQIWKDLLADEFLIVAPSPHGLSEVMFIYLNSGKMGSLRGFYGEYPEQFVYVADGKNVCWEKIVEQTAEQGKP